MPLGMPIPRSHQGKESKLGNLFILYTFYWGSYACLTFSFYKDEGYDQYLNATSHATTVTKTTTTTATITTTTTITANTATTTTASSTASTNNTEDIEMNI